MSVASPPETIPSLPDQTQSRHAIGYANVVAATAPTNGEDVTQGYGVNSMWFDTTAQRLWMCVDNTMNAAIWREFTIIAPSTNTVQFLSTDVQFSGVDVSFHP